MRYLFLPLFVLACSDPSVTPSERIKNHIEAVSLDRIEHQVINGLTGEPLVGAEVALVGTTQVNRTDRNGVAQVRLTPQHRWVRVNHPTFGSNQTHTGTTSRLWPHDVSDGAVATYFEARGRPNLDSDDLSDPDLTANARNRILRVRHHGDALDDVTPVHYLKQGLQPPATIRIYRRGPENNSCEGRVDVIPLEDYVKGVVPHEWIPSWHDESLRAGSIAARGYAWGWILAGGKYDCADLDDTTRSQVYREDRTDRADAATDSTRGVGIIRNGEFVQSEYSAENGDPTEFGVDEPLCTGRERFGHGRGMCQWGTQRWATERNQSAEWMVEHYYPGATTTNGTVQGGPQITLRQRLQRVDEIDCVDPESMYNCADFVNQGWSVGLFDLFVGHSATLTLEISNEGTSDAENVDVGIVVPTPFLSLSVITTPGQITENSTAHYSVIFDRLPPGSVQTIELTLLGSEYSVPNGSPSAVHTWVREITGIYQKEEWNTPASQNEGQTFNDGELVTLAEFDIFDARQWTWRSDDPSMLEGWSTVPDGVARGSAEGLIVTSGGERITIDSPLLPPTSEIIEVVSIDYDSVSPARLWWRSQEQPFSGERVMVLVAGENPVADGRLNEAAQFRLEVNGDATIRHLALLRSSMGSPRDSSIPIKDIGTTPSDAGLTIDAESTRDADSIQMPNKIPMQVRQVGGCFNMGADVARTFAWLMFLGTLIVLRRRRKDRV